MKAYIIVGMQKFGIDWDIIKTVFLDKDEAIKACKSLNEPISGWEWNIQEMEVK